MLAFVFCLCHVQLLTVSDVSSSSSSFEHPQVNTDLVLLLLKDMQTEAVDEQVSAEAVNRETKLGSAKCFSLQREGVVLILSPGGGAGQ